MNIALKAIASASIACGLCSVPTDSRSEVALSEVVLYGGNFCTPVLNALNSIDRSPVYGVKNVGAATKVVQCPFVNKYSANWGVFSVIVTVYDRNADTNVVCTVRGFQKTGTEIWSDTKSSTGSGAHPQSLKIGLGPVKATLGTLTMTCEIPGATPQGFSHVTTYQLATTP